MIHRAVLKVDAVVFGASAAGLWILDRLSRAGLRCLALEAGAMGQGQTIACQGIIHGGLKYTLGGMLTPSAQAIRDMPAVWRACLAGEAEPRLNDGRLADREAERWRGGNGQGGAGDGRAGGSVQLVDSMAATDAVLASPHCHLWRSASIGGRLGMIGARVGLRVTPVAIEREAWPEALAKVEGEVFRLEEQVVHPGGLLAALHRRHAGRVLRIDAEGVRFDCSGPGRVQGIELAAPGDASLRLLIQPRMVIFAAGVGNALLRERVGLARAMMQIRRVHMLLLRGELPPLHGHCVDGAKTRVTITSFRDRAGRMVWQVGGQVSEDGVDLGEAALIERGQCEVSQSLGGFDLSGTEWATYRADKAEVVTEGGRRPDDAFARLEGNTVTAWPTKLALVPRLAEQVCGMVGVAGKAARRDEAGLQTESSVATVFGAWPRPEVALPPWEEARRWRGVH